MNEPATNKQCLECGGPLEHKDSNYCMNCVEKMLADTEVFDG